MLLLQCAECQVVKSRATLNDRRGFQYCNNKLKETALLLLEVKHKICFHFTAELTKLDLIYKPLRTEL